MLYFTHLIQIPDYIRIRYYPKLDFDFLVIRKEVIQEADFGADGLFSRSDVLINESGDKCTFSYSRSHPKNGQFNKEFLTEFYDFI